MDIQKKEDMQGKDKRKNMWNRERHTFKKHCKSRISGIRQKERVLNYN